MGLEFTNPITLRSGCEDDYVSPAPLYVEPPTYTSESQWGEI